MRRLSAWLYSNTFKFGGLESGLQVVGTSLARAPPLQLLAHLPVGTRLRTSWLAGYTLCHLLVVVCMCALPARVNAIM